jgi:hypothetical protein
VDAPASLERVEEPLAAPVATTDVIGAGGERLTRNEAFDLVRRAVETLTTDDNDATRASEIRSRARELLGRDSESLNERMFVRILKDAHDGGVIDLRRRGDDFEVARAAEAPSVADQVARADAAASPPRPATAAATPRIGMGPRSAGGRARTRLEGPPPELFAVGVVDEPAPLVAATSAQTEQTQPIVAPEQPATEPVSRRGGGGRKRPRRVPDAIAAANATTEQIAAVVPEPERPAPVAKKSRAKSTAKTAARRARAKKTATKSPGE